MKHIIERTGQNRWMINQMIVSHFNQFPKSDKAVIEIKEDKDSRSVKQNRLYWMWLKVIEDETGQPKVDFLEGGKWSKGLHTRFKCDYLDKEFYADGSMKIPSTKKLKVKDFAAYLERIDMEIAQLGIMLPRPDDLYWDAMGVK
jgi:hypothetical protein